VGNAQRVDQIGRANIGARLRHMLHRPILFLAPLLRAFLVIRPTQG
jgi:hypothetical protein